MRTGIALALASLGLAATAAAQDKGAALVADMKALHDNTKGNIIKAAEKMPEEHYSFKPSDDVRSFGQIIGHVADAQYGLCGRAGSLERPAGGGIEKTKTAKADLVAALKEAITACDGVYASLTDAQAMERVKFFGGERSKLAVLSFNTTHNYEHYGNLVTYMRIKGLVPPSSEGR